MSNESRQLYQTFLKKGMQKDDAFFAIIDHYNSLHWHDRNAHLERIKTLEAKVAKLDKASHQE